MSMNQDARDHLSASIANQRDMLFKEIENQRYLLRSTLGIGSFLVIGLSAAAVYLIGNSISDLKSEVIDLASTKVEAAITQQEGNISRILSLNQKLSDSEKDYEKFKQSISALSTLTALDSIGTKDPHGTFLKLDKLADAYWVKKEPLRDEERATAYRLLESALSSAEQGLSEPNVIFNTAVTASRLGFSSEAVKLAVIAAYWEPKQSHFVLLREYESLYGVAYSFDGKYVTKINSKADVVRKAAWVSIKEIISSTPRQESEQAYSRMWNVAVRNRSNGYFADAIATIESSAKNPSNNLTSYALITLARLYAADSGPDWEAGYWSSINRAVDKLSEESSQSSWHTHSLRDMIASAIDIEEADRLFEILESKGVDIAKYR